MKSNKCVLFIVSSIFCLSLAIVFFAALYVKNSISGNLFALSFMNESTAFSNEDIEYLTRENYYFTFTARLESDVATEITASQVEVIGTNASFASINKLNVISGSFFNDIHGNKPGNVAVLNNAAAWHFFGNTNCAGNSISINKKQYQVIGVFESSSLHEDAKQIYVPYDNLKKHQAESDIFEILIAVDGISYIDPLIKNLEYLPEDIRIFDLEQYKNIMMQRIRVIVFLGGLYIIVRYLQRSLKNIKTFVQEAEDFFKENYVTDIWLLTKERHILRELLAFARNILLIFLTINIIKFKIYLPYYFFSINGLNYSVLNDLLNFFMQPYISVSFLSHLNGLNTVSNLMFFISILSGIVVISRLKAKG